MRVCWIVLVGLLAGCAAPPNRSTPGVDGDAYAREYRDCQALAETAVKTDADIDQDILATRQNDRQRSDVVRAQTQAMSDMTHDRAGRIVAACMRAKGFAPQP